MGVSHSSVKRWTAVRERTLTYYGGNVYKFEKHKVLPMYASTYLRRRRVLMRAFVNMTACALPAGYTWTNNSYLTYNEHSPECFQMRGTITCEVEQGVFLHPYISIERMVFDDDEFHIMLSHTVPEGLREADTPLVHRAFAIIAKALDLALERMYALTHIFDLDAIVHVRKYDTASQSVCNRVLDIVLANQYDHVTLVASRFTTANGHPPVDRSDPKALLCALKQMALQQHPKVHSL